MAYNQFTLARVQADFGIEIQTQIGIFGAVPPYPLSDRVKSVLPAYMALASTVNTEAARSQYLIAPMLGEVWLLAAGRIALYSATRFDVDVEAELNGTCDFILAKPPQLNSVRGPVLMVAEAKNEDMWAGVGQCAAAMVAAQRFNAATKADLPTGYGVVSDGESWRFMRMNGSILEIDLNDYLISDPDRILGILLHIVGIVP